MDKIFMDAKDKNVASVVIYANESDDTMAYFYDAEKTQEVPAEDMFDLFVKGVIVAFYSEEDDELAYACPMGYSKSHGLMLGGL